MPGVRFSVNAIVATLAAALTIAGCGREQAAPTTKVSGALVPETAASYRAQAEQELAQVARRRQIAAAQREAAAKFAASAALVTKRDGETRNDRLKREAESLAAAIDRRADEAQRDADYDLGVARQLEAAPGGAR
jgi:hypothetical protein